MECYGSILSLLVVLGGVKIILDLILALLSFLQSLLELFELSKIIGTSLLLLLLECCVLGDRIELADSRLVKQVEGTI